MAEDLETPQQETCCETWKKNYFQVLKKCSEIEKDKNQYKDHTDLLRQELDVIERQNKTLNQVLADIDAQASRWEDEKEEESAIRFALEDNVSALKDEIQLLKIADGQLQERLNDSEKEINRLKELLVIEKARADSEKKKADSALEEVETEKSKASEAQRLATIERKRADLAMSKVEGQRKLTELNLKKGEEIKQVEKKLKMENEELKSMLASEKSKSEEAAKKLEIEKQKTAEEKKRADFAVTNGKQHRELAEANLKKTRFEKDRADDLNRKLEEEMDKTRKLEEELRERLSALKLVGPDVSNTGKIVDLTTDAFAGTGNRDASVLPVWIKNMLLWKEQNLIKEKNHANSGTEKAKKQMKIAEKQKQIAIEEKHRADDQLTNELEIYKQELEESLVFYKTKADNTLGYDNIFETDSVKLLKKQLKLEKMLVKHAKEATKLEAIRNDLLHQELLHLKQESNQSHQRLDMLENSFFSDGESI